MVRGTVYDVAVDLRSDSRKPTENGLALFFPQRIRSSLYTQKDLPMDSWCCPMKRNSLISAWTSTIRGDEGGLLWSDPEIGVDWPIEPDMQLIISDKDRKWSGLRDTFKVLMKGIYYMNYVLSLMRKRL